MCARVRVRMRACVREFVRVYLCVRVCECVRVRVRARVSESVCVCVNLLPRKLRTVQSV